MNFMAASLVRNYYSTGFNNPPKTRLQVIEEYLRQAIKNNNQNQQAPIDLTDQDIRIAAAGILQRMRDDEALLLRPFPDLMLPMPLLISLII